LVSSNERRDTTRVATNLAVRVKCSLIEEFILQYATNVSIGGIFIQSRKPYPAGTIIQFEVQLRGGDTIIRGKGRVIWSRPPSPPDQKPKPPGMGVKFLQLDKASHELIARIVESKKSRAALATEALAAPPSATHAGSQPTSETTTPDLPDVEIDIDGEPNETPVAPIAAVESTADLDRLDITIEAPPPSPTPAIGIGKEADSQTTAGADDIVIDVEANGVTGSEPPTPVTTGSVRITRLPHDSPVVGIDLGTTYSYVAAVRDGKPTIIPNQKGYRNTPSIVAYDEEGRLLVGHEAKAQLELNPKNTVFGFKRLIGRPFSSIAVQQMKARFPYNIIPGPNYEAAVHLAQHDLSFQQISAYLLAELRTISCEQLGVEVTRAVITVPAYYNENQRKAVHQAGTLAGFRVERILNEPTAAALAFGFNRKLEQRMLVYDLGGGTFDASVLELSGNIYEVVATCGDTFLGGVDFNNQVADYLLECFCQQFGEVPTLDRAAIHRLRDAAEGAKDALSEKDETIVRLPLFATLNNTPKDLEVGLSRATLEELVGPLVERTLELTKTVLRQARIQANQLDNILLVGGQSRMPLIWRRVVETFAKEPVVDVNPDEAVAIGAAIAANSLSHIDSVVLIDVLPMTIGVGMPGGRFGRLLEAGTTLPTLRTLSMPNMWDNQTALELYLFQGESDRVLDNEYLGTLSINNITPGPRGSVQLNLTFSLDHECLLAVSSLEPLTGKVHETQLVARDTEDVIRHKLQIPKDEKASQILGVPESIRATIADRAKEPSISLLGKNK
jgi:molecular chaperone DnaK